MKIIEKKLVIVQKDVSELDIQEKELLEAAKQATYRSYVPYSNFHVGAALRLSNGTIVTGSNQENCAYPSGLCAERTALFYANSNQPDEAVVTLCIAARDIHGNFTELPVSPCGSCRQVMIETENRFHTPIKIMLYGTKGIFFVDSAKDMLPIDFDASFLD